MFCINSKITKLVKPQNVIFIVTTLFMELYKAGAPGKNEKQAGMCLFEDPHW